MCIRDRYLRYGCDIYDTFGGVTWWGYIVGQLRFLPRLVDLKRQQFSFPEVNIKSKCFLIKPKTQARRARIARTQTHTHARKNIQIIHKRKINFCYGLFFSDSVYKRGVVASCRPVQ